MNQFKTKQANKQTDKILFDLESIWLCMDGQSDYSTFAAIRDHRENSTRGLIPAQMEVKRILGRGGEEERWERK